MIKNRNQPTNQQWWKHWRSELCNDFANSFPPQPPWGEYYQTVVFLSSYICEVKTIKLLCSYQVTSVRWNPFPNLDSYQISWKDPLPLFSQAVHLSGRGKLHEGSHGGSLQLQVSTTTISSWDAPCWCWDWSSHEGIERVCLSNSIYTWLFLHTLSSGWTYSPNERVPRWSSNQISKRVQTIEQDQQKSRKVSYPLLPWPIVRGRQIQNLLKRNLWRVWG